MSERATPLQTIPSSPDVSLVAQKKPPPETLNTISRPAKPTPPKSISPLVDEKAKETEAIEREKKKSSMQKVGTKVKTNFHCLRKLQFFTLSFLDCYENIFG